jgi:putative Mn2+ efflux pump MntP
MFDVWHGIQIFSWRWIFLSLFTITLIAVGLAADAFAVSTASGIALQSKFRYRHCLLFGLYFGVFQFIMPVAGYYVGSLSADRLEDFSTWIGFALLSILGGKMVWESFKPNEVVRDVDKMLSVANMVMLAIATSIDAMAVGVGFALTRAPLWSSAAIIGGVAFALSGIGVFAGNKVGVVLGRKAELTGGLILICIGI